MEWYEDDELKEHWEEVKMMEERLLRRKVGEGVRQVEALQNALELVPYQRMSQCKKVEG